MSDRESADRVRQAQQELSGAQLPDQRLRARLQQVVAALARQPEQSLPVAMASGAALEASYRLLGNERVTAEAILRPHIENTLQRCRQFGRTLAVFDTTEVRLGGERAELGPLPQGRGMLAHVGLALSADGRSEPLGVLHLEAWARPAESKQRKRGAGQPDNERLRWHRAVEAVHRMSPDAVCVMDREADVFELLQEMSERGQSFVVRVAQNRNTEQGLLWEQLHDMPKLSSREVKLAARGARQRKREREQYPARSEHTARVELQARAVVLRSPDSSRNQKAPFQTLALHLVRVIEPQPPGQEPPLHWVLLTNLPIATAHDVDFVVDSYRARWTIEELFKALKSGCALERRQLGSLASMTNLLAVSLPIAWLVLRMRTVAREQPERPAASMLPAPMLHCLRVLYSQRSRQPLPEQPTARQLLWAVAALGGHIKNNGEPGLLVLSRGLSALINATDTALALGLL